MRRVVVLEMALALTILSAPAVCGQTFTDVEHELELVIRCDEKGLKRGDEIPIVFRITNKGDSPFKYIDRDFDRSGRIEEYVLEARGTDRMLVVDPRASYGVGHGGGFCSRGEIGPGKSFEKTIALNRWALIREAGRYSVIGRYHYPVYDKEASERYGSPQGRMAVVESDPIEVVVGERSNQEMGRYMARLAEELKTQGESELRGVAQRLIYTCDARIVPTLIEMMYSDDRGILGFWAQEGFLCYLPHSAAIKEQLLDAGRRRGLARRMESTLEYLGCSEDAFGEMIEISLKSDNAGVLTAGATAAREYPDDKYMTRLIKLATDGNSPAQSEAISAIACNRTDEGVRVLRSLLKDRDEKTRERTGEAIRRAYRNHPVYLNVLEDDYTGALAVLARDASDFYWVTAVCEIVCTRREEGIGAIRGLLADPETNSTVIEGDAGLAVIRDLLKSQDKEVRDRTADIVGGVFRVSTGRALREDDFPAEFREEPDQRKKKILARVNERLKSQRGRNPNWAKKMALAGVGNFHKVSDVLYRGAQPSEKGMKELEKIGIKTVVNLRSFHSDRDEMRGTKMGYEHITMKAWHAEEEELVRFLKIVSDKKRQPVFVHCQYGADRTGTMCAAYRIAVQGWTKEEAIEEMTQGDFGFHGVWSNLVEYIRKVDVEKIRKEAGLAE